MVEIANDSIMMNTPTMTFSNEQYDYIPVQPYWFHSKKVQDQITWIPFSLIDAQKLEQAHVEDREIVSTNGNRYDVNLIHRTHTSIYWLDQPNDIRRSKWYYTTPKNTRFIPFDEQTDDQLEKFYLETCNKQIWPTKYEVNHGKELIIFNTPNDMHYETLLEKRILKRGLPEIFLQEVKPDENDSIQHLCFVVHGIGSACDIKFRPINECVEDFRQTSRMTLENHFKTYVENDQIHRIEFLPIYWHGDLHLESTGVDNHLLPITLPSINRLRTFINTTLADILFYTSPIYSQRIITRCISEMNRLYELFLQRNPLFKGQISLIGHSLGSVILYDILSNQTSDIGITNNNIYYEKLKFPITYFFALGSPIAMFLTVRGITSIPSDFILPTCKGLLNIFHPYDPIAYRLEPLIDPEWNITPVLINHHKGRKRIHLEIVDRLSNTKDIKRKMFGVFKNTMTSITNFVESYTNSVDDTTTTRELEHMNDDEETHVIEWENRPIGKLNQGKRIDYVLQHGPIEAINEYIFAFTSHVTYWSSEDTMLLIVKEILKSDGFEAEKRFETIEQMIKSNVLNCFASSQTNKSDKFQAYITPKTL